VLGAQARWLGHGGIELAAQAPGTSRGTVALVDWRLAETGAVTSSGSSSMFAGFRFPREVISVAVRWYLRYGLSYRDVEVLLAKRGVTVDHVSIYRWVQRFTPEFIEAARPCRHAPGDRRFLDETGSSEAFHYAGGGIALGVEGCVHVTDDVRCARRHITLVGGVEDDAPRTSPEWGRVGAVR